MSKLLIARIDTFTPSGRFVSRGQAVPEAEAKAADGKISDNYIEAPEGVEGAVVEVSAIAPTGPNPKVPQQIAHDAVQTQDGYEQTGAKLVGEVTLPEKQRIEIVGIDKESTAQADVVEALAEADKGGNLSNEGTEGNVKEVSARVAEMDGAQLDELEARENDREQPRVGVISAIEKRRAALQG